MIVCIQGVVTAKFNAEKLIEKIGKIFATNLFAMNCMT